MRLDQGGPVTGDLDGDGLGDLSVGFYHSVVRDKKTSTFTDTTTWTSDGKRFEQQGTTRHGAPKGRYDQPFRGDFDADDAVDTLELQSYEDDDSSLRVVGTLSGGTRVDSRIAKPGRPTAFPGVVDVDGDGADDLVLQLYVDYKVTPSVFVSSVFDGTDFGEPRPVVELPLSEEDASFEVGDFDGDGRGDLVVLHQGVEGRAIGTYRQRLSVYLGTGDGFRRGPERTFTSSFGPDLLRGDLDGDEDDEVLVASLSQDTTVSLLDLRGGRWRGPTAAGALTASGSTHTPSAGVSDVNGDGLDDLVTVGQTGDDRATIAVAVSDGERLTTSRWGVWKRNFATSRFFSNLTVAGGSFL